MIAITPEIIGPGIEEEYADASARIDVLLDAFAAYPASNDTAHGRMVYQLRWLRQQIGAGRLPIPVNKSWIGTLSYLVGSGEVDDTPEIAQALGELLRILKGPGLLKPRHIPVIVSMIEDFVAAIHRYGDPLTATEATLAADLQAAAAGLRAGTIVPPLEAPRTRHPLRKALMDAQRLRKLFPQHPDKRDFFTYAHFLELPLFEGWRPYVAKKPPLPAPNPGLAPEAPDFTLIRDLTRTDVTPRRP